MCNRDITDQEKQAILILGEELGRVWWNIADSFEAATGLKLTRTDIVLISPSAGKIN